MNYRIRGHDVDQFTYSYMETALWSSSGTRPDGTEIENLDSEFDPYDIAEETVVAMIADCAKFQHDNWDDIKHALGRAGHDMWLTRCGHGAGYWDGDWGDAGDRLTAACKQYGNVDLCIGDDGLIYQE